MQALLKLGKHQMQYKNWCVIQEQEDLRGTVWDFFTLSYLELQLLEILMTNSHPPFILQEPT